jgi:hypothetical protein
MMMNFPTELTGLAIPFAIVFWLITFLINLAFALGVSRDAGQLADSGKGPVLVGQGIWMLATLFGGVFVAAVYWLIHHSTLRPE